MRSDIRQKVTNAEPLREDMCTRERRDEPAENQQHTCVHTDWLMNHRHNHREARKHPSSLDRTNRADSRAKRLEKGTRRCMVYAQKVHSCHKKADRAEKKKDKAFEIRITRPSKERAQR